jgi:hypothetical protein
MAALNFPSSPAVNDTFTVGNTTWVFDGTVWKVKTPVQQAARSAAARLYMHRTFGGL